MMTSFIRNQREIKSEVSASPSLYGESGRPFLPRAAQNSFAARRCSSERRSTVVASSSGSSRDGSLSSAGSGRPFRTPSHHSLSTALSAESR